MFIHKHSQRHQSHAHTYTGGSLGPRAQKLESGAHAQAPAINHMTMFTSDDVVQVGLLLYTDMYASTVDTLQ